MLFGTQSPRKGMFGMPGVMPGDQPGQPGYPMGGAGPFPGGNPGYPSEPPAQKRKVNWGGVAADFLAGLVGQPGQYLASIQAEQERAAKAREYQQRRADENTDWRSRETWKRDNPEPGNPYRFEDNAGNVYERGQDGTNNLIFTDPNDKVFMQDGQMITVPNRVRSQSPAIPAPGAVVSDPRLLGGTAPAGTPPFDGSGGKLDQITMMSESSGNPNAVSPKGARGLMQVMPGTERDPGFGIRPGNGSADDRTRVGREYRAKMQQRYGGDLRKMWAAYNWGPGNLEAAIAKYGENGWFSRAPQETRDYIARNLRAMKGI